MATESRSKHNIDELIEAAEKARVVVEQIEKRDTEYELRTITGKVSPA